jgi:hypothetical protein
LSLFDIKMESSCIEQSMIGDIDSGYGFNSHPQLHNSTLVPQPISISLKGTNTNPKKIDIHEIEKTFERTLERPKTKIDIEEEDKTAILKFVDHLFAKNMTKLRAIKYIYQMSVVARIAGKPLGSLDRKGMERVISQINKAKYSDNTKHDFKVAIRKYFQWLRGCNEETAEFPDEVRWIKPKNRKTRLLPEALVTGKIYESLLMRLIICETKHLFLPTMKLVAELAKSFLV